MLTFAGRGQQGFIDAGSTDALFSNPWVLAFNAAGNALYVGDGGDQRVRKVDMSSKQVTTITGSGTSGPAVRAIWEALYGINGMTVDPANAAIPGTTPPDGLPTFMDDGSILPPARSASSKGESQ